MKVLWEYLKDHRKIGLFLVTAAAVEGLVFWLYHLPAAAVAYASVIIAFFGMALAVPDFLGYRRRHQALLRTRTCRSRQAFWSGIITRLQSRFFWRRAEERSSGRSGCVS